MAEPDKGIKNSDQEILSFAAYAIGRWTIKKETAREHAASISRSEPTCIRVE